MPADPDSMSKERTSVELFAGAGGLAQAVARAGFRALLLNEWDRWAGQTLEANGAKPRIEARAPGLGDPTPLVVGDVRDLDLGYLRPSGVDVLAGGCPCQPFSLGGAHRGDEDERNGFPHIFRAMREIRPKAILVENVRGLLRESFRPYFEYIQRELSLPFIERGPDVDWREHHEALKCLAGSSNGDASERYDIVVTPVNAADYGAPQVRKRVIMVAFRSDLNVDLESFKRAVLPTHSEAALHLSMRNGAYWARHAQVPAGLRRRVVDALPPEMPDDGLLPWRTLRDAIMGVDYERPLPPVTQELLDRRERYLDGFTDHVGWPGARIYPGHTPSVMDRPAKTVKAGVHGVPGGESVMMLDDGSHRYMTVRETARVMTFPDAWRLEGSRSEKMRQLGNAVPVKLGETFAQAVHDALEATDA